MITYTTPALPLDVEGIDLTQQQDVYVSFEQIDNYFEKRNSDLVITVTTKEQVPTSHIIVLLSQEETGSFKAGKQVSIQVNWINSSEVRDATDIATFGVERNLKDEVIEYGN